MREVFDFIAVQAAARGVTLSNVPAQQMLQVHGDRIQIQQVILNLILNGMEAMADAPGGQRQIIGRTVQLDDTFAEISISDFGPGISVDLEKVFDPFFTTKTEGMGMELSGTPGAWISFVTGFRRGLTEAGFVEGRNVTIEFRWAEGLIDRVPGFIADLAQRRVAVIFVRGSDAVVLAAKSAISSIPIVFATGGDPVEYGIVASLNRPGGNATGVTIITAALWPKRLELLRELVPSRSLFGVLVNPNHPSSAASTKDVREAARTLGQEIRVVNVRAEREIDMAFDTLVQQRVNGLLVANDPLFTGRREQLIALASRHAIPTVYDRPEFTKAGGLMSYGASTVEQYRQAGFYTGRVLKCEKPADLPVLQPTKFELL